MDGGAQKSHGLATEVARASPSQGCYQKKKQLKSKQKMYAIDVTNIKFSLF